MAEVFVWLMLVHFIADFMFQTSQQARFKIDDPYERCWHVFVYGICLSLYIGAFFGSHPLMILYIQLAHYVIDGYKINYLWHRYVKRVPLASFEDFKEFASTPIGMILTITVDQILHAISYLPIAYALSKIAF